MTKSLEVRANLYVRERVISTGTRLFEREVESAHRTEFLEVGEVVYEIKIPEEMAEYDNLANMARTSIRGLIEISQRQGFDLPEIKIKYTPRYGRMG